MASRRDAGHDTRTGTARLRRRRRVGTARARGRTWVLFLPARSSAMPRTVEPTLDPRTPSGRSRINTAGTWLRSPGPAWSASGVIVLADGSYAAESTYGRSRLEQEADYYAPRRRKIVTMPGDYFSLVVHWSDRGNYYHWVHDTLTQLYEVMDLVPAGTRFIVPSDLKPFQQESLRLVGIGDEQTRAFPGKEAWELETLHFAPPCQLGQRPAGRRRLGAATRSSTVRDRRATGAPHLRQPARRPTPTRERAGGRGAPGTGTASRPSSPRNLTLREQVAAFSQAEIRVDARRRVHQHAVRGARDSRSST